MSWRPWVSIGGRVRLNLWPRRASVSTRVGPVRVSTSGWASARLPGGVYAGARVLPRRARVARTSRTAPHTGRARFVR